MPQKMIICPWGSFLTFILSKIFQNSFCNHLEHFWTWFHANKKNNKVTSFRTFGIYSMTFERCLRSNVLIWQTFCRIFVRFFLKIYLSWNWNYFDINRDRKCYQAKKLIETWRHLNIKLKNWFHEICHDNYWKHFDFFLDETHFI